MYKRKQRDNKYLREQQIQLIGYKSRHICKGIAREETQTVEQSTTIQKIYPPPKKKTFNYLLKGHAGYLGKTSQNNTL